MHSKSCEATGFGTWLPKKSKLVQREGVVEPCAVYTVYLLIRSRYGHATFFNVKRTDRRIT